MSWGVYVATHEGQKHFANNPEGKRKALDYAEAERVKGNYSAVFYMGLMIYPDDYARPEDREQARRYREGFNRERGGMAQVGETDRKATINRIFQGTH